MNIYQLPAIEDTIEYPLSVYIQHPTTGKKEVLSAGIMLKEVQTGWANTHIVELAVAEVYMTHQGRDLMRGRPREDFRAYVKSTTLLGARLAWIGILDEVVTKLLKSPGFQILSAQGDEPSVEHQVENWHYVNHVAQSGQVEHVVPDITPIPNFKVNPGKPPSPEMQEMIDKQRKSRRARAEAAKNRAKDRNAHAATAAAPVASQAQAQGSAAQPADLPVRAARVAAGDTGHGAVDLPERVPGLDPRAD